VYTSETVLCVYFRDSFMCILQRQFYVYTSETLVYIKRTQWLTLNQALLDSRRVPNHIVD